MMPGVESSITRIVVVPLLVVDRDSHFRRVAVVETIVATKVLLAVEILWVVNIGIVVKTIPVAEIGLSSPCSAVRFLLR